MTKKIKPIVLSRASQSKLDAFDEATCAWGLLQDYGSAQESVEAEARHKEAKQQLEKHIRRLEGLVRAAKRKEAEWKAWPRKSVDQGADYV